MMLLAVPSAGEGEWSEWGGSPAKNMVAKETGLPVEFSTGEESTDSTGINLATAKHFPSSRSIPNGFLPARKREGRKN